jgi:hypothetical protein
VKAFNNHDTAAALLLVLILSSACATAGYSQAPPPKITYLSDLTPVGTPINGYGPYEKDKSNGENAAGDGSPLRMGRIPYDKGLGVHAFSDLTFALNKQYANFSAAVGIDDELLANGCAPDLPGSVVFQVFVDDLKVYESGAVSIRSSALDVNVDVTGKSTLRLVVGGAGDDLACDHADWADAKLTGIVVSESQTFSASSGFATTQGQNGWSYLDSTGAQLTYRPADNAYPSDIWQGSEQYPIVSRDGGHPGDSKDSIRRWTAPQAGSIRIAGNARDGDPACGRGVAILIKKGSTTLWQAAISNGDTKGVNFDLPATVNQNDTVDFVINKGVDGNNLCDTTVFDPTIVLTTPTSP